MDLCCLSYFEHTARYFSNITRGTFRCVYVIPAKQKVREAVEENEYFSIFGARNAMLSMYLPKLYNKAHIILILLFNCK